MNIEYVGPQRFFREDFLQHRIPFHWKNGEQKYSRYWEYAAHTGHWNYQGHEVVANALLKALPVLLKPGKPVNGKSPPAGNAG